MFDLRFLIGLETMSLTVNPIPYSRPDPMHITQETKEPDFPEINILPVSLRHLTIMGVIKTRKEKHKRRLRQVLSRSHRKKKIRNSVLGSHFNTLFGHPKAKPGTHDKGACGTLPDSDRFQEPGDLWRPKPPTPIDVRPALYGEYSASPSVNAMAY